MRIDGELMEIWLNEVCDTLHPGPSFLHFSLYLPLDQILHPRPCPDVRPYMLVSTILDSRPISWDIDL